MKFTTRTISEQGEHTIDGITAPVTRTRTVSVPKLPRDWDTAAVRGASGLVLVLTLISVLWSTWSIGSLLHGGIGYITATIFDVAWAVCLLLEWMSRYDAAKRAFPRRLGWGLLVCTMLAIGWHGLTLHSVPLAVVGAAVSFFAKVLWLGVMKHVDRDLSADDAQWVAAQISAANAKLAVAGVRRQVARQEARAVLELTAMEAERAELAMALGVPLADLSGSVVPPSAGEILSGSVAVPAQAPQHAPASDGQAPAIAPAFVEPHFADGTSAGTSRDDEGEVPQFTTGESVRSAGTGRHLTPVRGTATAQIRDLIGQGLTDVPEIRTRLVESGIKAPDPSYVRRIIREARNNESTDAPMAGTGNYM